MVIGSQALLVAKPDADRAFRQSNEVDAYPGNLREWEEAHGGQEASEVINAILGEGSDFHKEHGFFVDGVDDTTAKLSGDWISRAARRMTMVEGRQIEVIAPDPHDIVAAKLARGDPKDIEFARLCLKRGFVRYKKVEALLQRILEPAAIEQGLRCLKAARHEGKSIGDGGGPSY